MVTENNLDVQHTAVDLFCGCGGMTQGLRMAGFKVLGAVDNNALCVDTFRLNHSDVHVWEKDIRQLEAEELIRKLGLHQGELDLLAGCPPCQGFSRLRTLNGGRTIDDDRNDLVLDMLRFIRVLLPKAIMMENVPALARDHRMALFLKELSELGYYAESDTIQVANAADFGVPQRRRRMILLSGSFGAIDFPQISLVRQTVRQAIGGLPEPGKSGDKLHDFPERRSQNTIRLIQQIPLDGGSRTDLPDDQQLQCHRGFDGFKDIYGRMCLEDVAPTITSGCTNPSKGRFLHPTEHRAITLREAALLQSFPADYRFSLERGKNAAAAMIGNALPPEFVRRHAIAIRATLAGST